jgi:hypothetical protein
MEAVADQVVRYAQRCYPLEVDPDYKTMSPYIPLSLYQAAVACDRQYRISRRASTAVDAETLKLILALFAKRWGNAGIVMLDRVNVECLLMIRSSMLLAISC